MRKVEQTFGRKKICFSYDLSMRISDIVVWLTHTCRHSHTDTLLYSRRCSKACIKLFFSSAPLLIISLLPVTIFIIWKRSEAAMATICKKRTFCFWHYIHDVIYRFYMWGMCYYFSFYVTVHCASICIRYKDSYMKRA